MFQKVNDWLADKSERFGRGDASRTPNGAYYASNEAEQAFGGMQKSSAGGSATSDTRTAGEMTGRAAPVDRFSAENTDKYGGRVPYRSQKDMQAEMDVQRQQQEDQSRRQQTAGQRQQAQQFNRPQPAAYPQPQAQGNIVPFPGMMRSPEGTLYAHVEYVVLLRSRNECTKVIEYIKANASVFLNMEFIANDSERQRCVDMLSGAAYTLGCQLSKISPRGIYLISSPSVCLVMDPAMQKFASAPESQGYVRPEYAAYNNYGAGAQTTAYAAQPAAGYGAAQPNAYANGARSAAYAGQPAANGVTGARTAAYAQRGAQPSSYPAQSNPAYNGGGARTAGYAAQPMQGGIPTGQSAPNAGAPGAQTSPYAAAQPNGGMKPGGQTAPYAAMPGAQTGAYATAPYAAQPNAAYGTRAQAQQTAPQTPAQPRRTNAAFGMQGPFMRSAEGSQQR